MSDINNTISGCGIKALALEKERFGYIRVIFPDVAGIPEGLCLRPFISNGQLKAVPGIFPLMDDSPCILKGLALLPSEVANPQINIM